MNPLRNICLMACLLAVVCASTPKQQNLRSNSLSNSLKPSHWLPVSKLESLPAVDEVTLQSLENMSVDEGADLISKIYHIAQTQPEMEPTYVPNPSDITAYIVKPNGQKVNFRFNELVEKAKEQGRNFGDEEVTIFITGLPQNTPTVKKATKKLAEAYMQRYNVQQQRQQQSSMDYEYDSGNKNRAAASNEDYDQQWKSSSVSTGDLVIIDLGSTLNFKRIVMLDTEKTGNMMAKVFVQLTDELNMPFENVHLIAQGVAANVAGAIGRQFTRLTGHQLRRITALDPAKIYARKASTLTGLARGDAEFVDAIHTSAYGMGTVTRVGNVDFYPNGPSEGVPGADNIIEASMRATRYFAETVRPGNERNFPAVPAVSLQDYKNNRGYGRRTYMGIDADFDLEGDYILEVNPKSPFGKSTPARKQAPYHDIHTPERYWDASNDA